MAINWISGSIVSLCAFAVILNLMDIETNLKIRAMGIVALLPNYAILSVIFLRESIVTMFVSLSLLCFAFWIDTDWEMFFIGAVLFSFAGAIFHSGIVSMVLGYIIVRIFYDKRRKTIHIRYSNLIVVMILSLIFVYLYINYESLLFSKIMGVENISDIANINEKGGSSYAEYVGNSDSVWNLIRYTIPRMFYFSFSPFPWQWRGGSDIIAFMFSSVFYLAAVFESVRKMIHKGKNRIYIIMLFCVLAAMDFVFGWGTSNVGTAARHRDKMVILFGTLWALGHDGSRNRFITLGGDIII